MKKVSAIFVMAMLICSSAFAGSLTPKTKFEKCMASVEKACTAQGLKNPWGGGNIADWNACTTPKYNSCWCNHKGKPLPNLSC